MSRCPMSNLSTSQSFLQALQVPRLGSLTTSTEPKGSLADAWASICPAIGWFNKSKNDWKTMGKPWDSMVTVTVVVVFAKNHSTEASCSLCSTPAWCNGLVEWPSSPDLSPRNFELIALTRVSTAIRSTTRCHDGLQKEDTWKKNMRDANRETPRTRFDPICRVFTYFYLLVSECFVAIFPQIAWMCFFQSNSQSPWYATSI